MALRFRKSIKIFPGVKINIGKTGASLSVGVPGYHKTFHTDGSVTTTFGIPGTGVSWSERSSGRRRNNTTIQGPYEVSSEQITRYNTDTVSSSENIRSSSIERDEQTREYVPVSKQVETAIKNEHTKTVKRTYLNVNSIKRIYVRCDDSIEWTEIISGTNNEELYMDKDIWEYCRGIAGKILSGNIDAYYEVIEELRPVDDLLLYGCDFEFGTDRPNYIEVEFRAKPEYVLENGVHDELLEEFVCGTSIRVARDLLALLPISKVIVHTHIDDRDVLSVLFTRQGLININFKGTNAKDIISKFKNNNSFSKLNSISVNRLTLD